MRTRDVHILELRGYPIAWRTDQSAEIPGVEGVEYRPGLVSIGSTLRSRLEALDIIGRPSGLTFELDGDSALELLRGAPAQVNGVNMLYEIGEYLEKGATEAWFSGELDPGVYCVGSEVIEVGADVTPTGPDAPDVPGADLRRYEITRGVRDARVRPLPLMFQQAEDLYEQGVGFGLDSVFYRDDAIEYAESPIGLSARAWVRVEGVYPDGEPGKIRGWPVRLWRSSNGGTPVVVYSGTIDRVNSAGARVTVQTQPQARADIQQQWHAPQAAGLATTPELTRPLRPQNGAWVVRLASTPTPPVPTFNEAVGVRISGAQRLTTEGRSVVVVPRSQLEEPDQVGAVIVSPVDNDGWVALPVVRRIVPPFTLFGRGSASDLEVPAAIGDRWYIYELASIDDTGVAPVMAYGEGKAVLDYYGSPRDQMQTSVEFRGAKEELPEFLAERYRWLEVLGIDPVDLVQEGAEFESFEIPMTVSMHLAPRNRPDRWPRDLRGATDIPDEIFEEMLWEPRCISTSVGASQDGAEIVLARASLRFPYPGATVEKVLEMQIGARPLGVGLSPDGSMNLVRWLLTEEDEPVIVDTDILRDTVRTEVGGRTGVRLISLDAGDRAISANVRVKTGVFTPNGVEITREIDAVALGADGVIAGIIGDWHAALRRYSRNVPVATFSLRDDGETPRLAPGDEIRLVDPAAPNPIGERGLDVRGMVTQVSRGTERRTSDVTALLTGYDPEFVTRLWGPAVELLESESGADVTVEVDDILSDGSLRRFRRLVEVFVEVPVLVLRAGGETILQALLTEAGASTLRLASDPAQAYQEGDTVVVGAEVGATAYVGEDSWQ